MALSMLLSTDGEARQLFQSLPIAIQQRLTQTGGSITSLAALRDYANNLIAHSAPQYNDLNGINSGVPLDPTLIAEWTMEHEC